MMLKDRHKGQARNGDARQNRTQGRSGQLQSEGKDQDRRDNCVDQTAHHCGGHRTASIAMRAQDRATRHTDQKDGQRRNDDLQVVNGKHCRLTRRAQQSDQHTKVLPDQHGKNRCKDHTGHKRVRRPLSRQFLITCAQGLRHQRAGRDSDADVE